MIRVHAYVVVHHKPALWRLARFHPDMLHLWQNLVLVAGKPPMLLILLLMPDVELTWIGQI